MVCPPKRFGHMGNVKGEMYYGISAFFQKAIYSPDLVVSDQPLSGVRRYYLRRRGKKREDSLPEFILCSLGVFGL